MEDFSHQGKEQEELGIYRPLVVYRRGIQLELVDI
jgi:hypothetical protein